MVEIGTMVDHNYEFGTTDINYKLVFYMYNKLNTCNNNKKN